MPLNPTQQTALNAFLATLDQTPSAEIPWWHATGAAPTVPLADPTNEAELKRYMSFGLKYNLGRGVAQQDFPTYLSIADQLNAAATPQAADLILANAGKFPTDVAIYITLAGGVQGLGPFQSASIFAPATIQTIADAAKWAVGTYPGPGPGVG